MNESRMQSIQARFMIRQILNPRRTTCGNAKHSSKMYRLTRGNAEWRSKLETVLPLNSWAPATMKNQSEQDALLPLNKIPPFSWLLDSNNITRVRHANLGNANRLSIMCWSTCGKAKWSTKMRRATWGNANRSSTSWLLFQFLRELDKLLQLS